MFKRHRITGELRQEKGSTDRVFAFGAGRLVVQNGYVDTEDGLKTLVAFHSEDVEESGATMTFGVGEFDEFESLED